MIYDLSYFKNELHIPNIYDDVDIVSNNEKLLEVMRNSDVKFLTDCFGFKIAKDVLNAVDEDGNVKAGTDATIEKLINGDEDKDWLGLRYEVNGVKKSILANFAFCQYLYQTETELTQVGNVKDNVENGNRVSNWGKYVSVWNEMLKQRQKDYEVTDYNWYLQLKNTYGITLQEFINQNSETFAFDKFLRLEKVNSFGL